MSKPYASVEALKKEIDSLKKAGSSLDARIHRAGVAVLVHFAEHKDTGLINRLYDALPRGARKTAWVSWILTYAAVVANTDKATKEEKPFVYAKDKATNPEGGDADPWYNHKPEKAPDEVFDLQKAVKAILAKAGKAKSIKNGNADALKALAAAVGIPESDVPAKA